VFKIESIKHVDSNAGVKYGMLLEDTEIEIKSSSSELRIVSSNMSSKNMFSDNFSLETLGVGGLDEQILEIFREAFSLRRLPEAIRQQYGSDPAKGILLFGPPGTGKTLLARQMAECLNAAEIEVVNGPELLNAYVGKSEENVRNLFSKAKKDQESLGRDSPLHVIIFDEFDAIAKPRGSTGDNTGVAANVVNQLLTMIDGVDALNNILVIGMTNRKDLIDSAILRKGRFGVHIEVGLPDETGREQIFKIHTATMKKNNLLGPDVDIKYLSKETKNYTGSEIKDLVNTANTFAIERKYNLLDFTQEIKFDMNNIAKIDMQDFQAAMLKVRPSFGVDDDNIGRRLKGTFVEYGKRFTEMRDNLVATIKAFSKSSIGVSSVLLHGSNGTGKTAIACSLAKHSGIPFAKLISSEDIVGMAGFGKVKKIVDTFGEAYSSKISLIVLDDIER